MSTMSEIDILTHVSGGSCGLSLVRDILRDGTYPLELRSDGGWWPVTKIVKTFYGQHIIEGVWYLMSPDGNTAWRVTRDQMIWVRIAPPETSRRIRTKGDTAMTAARTRQFHLGDILTITTGRLVSPRHMDGVYDILNYMTGDNLFTHQLPRAMDECQGPLLTQLPGLAEIAVPSDLTGKEAVEAWLATVTAKYGKTLPVAPLADSDHTHIDPITELQAIRPDAEIVVVETD